MAKNTKGEFMGVRKPKGYKHQQVVKPYDMSGDNPTCIGSANGTVNKSGERKSYSNTSL